MNAPVSPPVDLSNLANLGPGPLAALADQRPVTRNARVTKLALPLGATLVGATGALVWRLVSLEVARQRRSRRRLGLAGGATLGAFAALAFTRWQLQRLFNANPAHEVESRRGLLEIRRYPSVRVAETTVDARWDEALEQGFRRLAGFIFGGNDAQDRIAMTSPVLGTGDGDAFRFTFFLPADIAAPPTPSDPRVAVRELPPRRIAVLRFNGRYDAANIEAHKRTLIHELAENGLHPRGEASFAGYDPPSTLPLLRRVELWVELDESAPQS